jgi:hypothetical protein
MLRCSLRIAFALAVIQIASCSSGETFYPVSGLVKVDGKPASGALLTFHPDPPGDPKTTFPATAKAGTDGKFTVATGANGGVKAGKYFVTIIWPDPNKKLTDAQRMMGASPDDAPDLLGGRYSTREKSQLQVEVKPGVKELPPFELK